MKINTRLFGEIEIAESRIITFESPIMGFEEYKRYTLIYDSENKGDIMWLQSIEEPELAFTVMDPSSILEKYSPLVEDELLTSLGKVETDEDYFVLTVITIPSDITKMTANLKAPIVINTKTNKASQIVVNNEEYVVRFNIYDYIMKLKESN